MYKHKDKLAYIVCFSKMASLKNNEPFSLGLLINSQKPAKTVQRLMVKLETSKKCKNCSKRRNQRKLCKD